MGFRKAWTGKSGPTGSAPNVDATDDSHTWLGVSVYWMKHGLLQEVYAAGLDDIATIYDLDMHDGKKGVIRTKGQKTISPGDGKIGAAYVNWLGRDVDKLGRANFMLSYSWAYSIGDIVDTLLDFRSSHGLDQQTSYV